MSLSDKIPFLCIKDWLPRKNAPSLLG